MSGIDQQRLRKQGVTENLCEAAQLPRLMNHARQTVVVVVVVSYLHSRAMLRGLRHNDLRGDRRTCPSAYCRLRGMIAAAACFLRRHYPAFALVALKRRPLGARPTPWRLHQTSRDCRTWSPEDWNRYGACWLLRLRPVLRVACCVLHVACCMLGR